jgi:hypothetical protein
VKPFSCPPDTNQTNKLSVDTSQQSKENSRRAIENLGGADITYGKQDMPISKSAAENLEGSRVVKA